MDTLGVIRHITQNPKYTNIVIMDALSYSAERVMNTNINEIDRTPMDAIGYLASIDASHYDDFRWRLEGSLEKNTLLIIR
jgi:hypothetical protein